MCTRVIVGNADLHIPTWDRANVAIIVNRRLSAAAALLQVRTLLFVLGAPQDNLSATCWCGDEVDLPQMAIRMPRQFTPKHHEEVRRGA